MQVPKTVIINCAGIGSRLGLGQTKALIEIHNKPLIYWQLEMLHQVEDLRVVVGYQAQQLIKIVLQKRSDVLFVYNHEYFHTKTAQSLYLGSRHAHDLILSLDGDTIIHPEDMQLCLASNEEFIGYSLAMSEEPVYVNLKHERVESFSSNTSDYEWIGPALLHRDKLTSNTDLHLYQILEPFLPIKGREIRALDIDTPADYRNAIKVLSQWIK